MLTVLIMFRFHVTNQNAFLRVCSKIFLKVDVFDIWLFFVISWIWQPFCTNQKISNAQLGVHEVDTG